MPSIVLVGRVSDRGVRISFLYGYQDMMSITEGEISGKKFTSFRSARSEVWATSRG